MEPTHKNATAWKVPANCVETGMTRIGNHMWRVKVNTKPPTKGFKFMKEIIVVPGLLV